MDAVSVSSLVIGLVSGVISSILTYFGTRSKIRLDMTVEYDKALHDKRLALYKELWPKTKPLPRFEQHFALPYNTIMKVAAETRDWYFNEGGIYLSKHSRKPYFDLKERKNSCNGCLTTKSWKQRQTPKLILKHAKR